MTTATQLNETKLNQIVGRALDDVAAISSSALVLIGGQLGLYEALERIGPATPQELATERDLAAVFEAGGFSSFRRAAESFTNRVFEARA